jgi:hypothetical protein
LEETAGEREKLAMERLRILKMEERASIQDFHQGEIKDPLERFKAVTRDLTEKALEIVHRISVSEISKSKPQTEIMEDCYLLFHTLDFLKRFASSKA